AVAGDSSAARIGFSHAYYGAIRHAVTVGFISLMIVGVAAKVVPTLNGVDLRSLSSLWAPFILINAGCALRVGAQILTDITLAAYPWAGVSGLLEVMGLAIWGIHLWSIMDGRIPMPREEAVCRESLIGLVPGSPIASHHVVGDVLGCHPELLE